jgi:hypothetical protein
VGVPTDVVIRVRFDDYPDPDTVRSDSLLLTTGYFWVPAVYGVDLVAKTVTLQPWQALSPDLGYAIHLKPILRSLQGCAAPDALREFRTGAGPAGIPVPPVPPLAQVQALFDRRCGGSTCHLDPGPLAGCLTQPAAGLSLCAGETFDALVGVPSVEETRLLRVDPGDSARSYLLRKLIPATPGGGPPPPTLGHRDPPGEPLDEAEIAAVAAWIDGGALR